MPSLLTTRELVLARVFSAPDYYSQASSLPAKNMLASINGSRS